MDIEFDFVAEFPHLLDAFFDVKEENKHLRELLREGLKATQLADGHWSDRFRWTNWVIKVEKELADG